MPAQQKNSLARVLVPILLIIVGIGITFAVFLGGKSKPIPPTPSATPGTTPTATAPTPTTSDSTSATTSATPADASPGLSAPATPFVGKLRARAYDNASSPAPLGSLDPSTGYRAQIVLSNLGAGIESITSTNDFASLRDKINTERLQKDPQLADKIGSPEHYEIQSRGRVQNTDGTFSSVLSLAALGVSINGQFVGLFSDTSSGSVRPVWQQVSSGEFVAEIVDESDTPIARVTRHYEFSPDKYDFGVRQSFTNLTAQPMKVQWWQYGPVDLSEDKSGYSMDLVRRIRFGYQTDPSVRAPAPYDVSVDSELMSRTTVVNRVTKWMQAAATNPSTAPLTPLWPNASKFKRAAHLTWVAQTSRYFTFVVHPFITDAAAPPTEKALTLAAEVRPVVLGYKTDKDDFRRLALQFTSNPIDVAPGAPLDLSFGAYAGPLSQKHLSSKVNPVFGVLGLDRMVIYNIGGPCSFCTFQWIARPLVAFLSFLHDYVVHDWAIAIMILVFCVRAVLHPITKRSQIGLTRFGKQMQRLGPKQKALQAKYAGDPKRLQQEIGRLMREENVSYRGALGCLPMFLQTPIWIAVYAVIYFTFTLRHEPAFFGVFQAVSNGGWAFLGDLSAPDHFIDFGKTFKVPLMGNVGGINVLPVILGVLFYIQQKYLTPPTTPGALTPEQEMQQKTIKIMMVFLFPLMMYNAPSGLTIYFLTNSTLGILEGRWIRAHITSLDLDNPNSPANQPRARKRVENTATPTFTKLRDRKHFKDR